jgi:hypothetical protein
LIEDYTRWIAAGRDDLAVEIGRLRAATGVVLFRTGDLAAAIAATEGGLTTLSATSFPAARASAQGLRAELNRLRALAVLTEADIPSEVAKLREHHAAESRISASGEVYAASQLFEMDMATGLALARIRPTEDLVVLCGDLGQGVGVTASYVGRDGAAAGGFHAAVNCFRFLFDQTADGDYLARWCDSKVGVISLLSRQGVSTADVERELKAVETELQRMDPASAAERGAKIRSVLSEIGVGGSDPTPPNRSTP